jgi:hypothetical protein
MTHIEVTDRNGQRRRAQPDEVAQDGETFFFPTTFMDAATVLAEKYGKPGYVGACRHSVTDHRPQARVRGYAFTDNTTVAQDAREAAAHAYEEKRARFDSSRRNVSDGTAMDARQAYDERSARMANAWRKDMDNAAPARPQDAAQAKALADGAWQEKKARLQNGWRTR